ncbi:MAG TPA: radical SAM protein [Anaeromyxobacter sp.]|nr:radical SAM protein [Anaeromyxobacter sp.]
MKLALVSPEFPCSGRVPVVPPILEYLGALTLRERPETELQLVDANQTPLRPEDVRGDLVGVSVWTATAPWAYRFADACRALGKRVVLGGIHATALPDEAMRHADAVVVGEAESCWGEVLRDAAAGRLRARYDGVQLPLERLPTPLDASLPGTYRFRAFFTMRGCPYACTFCSVHTFFGRTIRYRPIPEVVAEIEARAGGVWFDGDDNIWGADPARAVALFDALAAGTRRSWYGFGDLRSLEGPHGERMLAAARRSGLFSVWVGWESDSPEALRDWRALGKQGRDRLEAVKRIQGHGIEVVLFVVLGGRGDDADSFRRTLELADRLKVGVHPVLLTPLPGTALHDAYRPHLLPGLGWEAYTGVRAVFEHPDPALTPVAREAAYHELCRELYRPARMLRRLTGIPVAGFPKTHLLSLVKQLPMRRALARAREAWIAQNGAAPGAQPG